MPTREWSPLTTHFSVTSDSSPRSSAVDSIGEHHAAATSRDLCLMLFQPGGRTVSPNYLVYRTEIWGIVPENKRAWTSSDAWADSRSITKEIVNETGSPDYSFHPDTLESVMRLDADIAAFYGIQKAHTIPGFWEHRNLYEWYGRSYATACAGPSFNINAIIAGASAIGAGGGARPITQGEFEMLVFANTDTNAWKAGIPFGGVWDDVPSGQGEAYLKASGRDLVRVNSAEMGIIADLCQRRAASGAVSVYAPIEGGSWRLVGPDVDFPLNTADAALFQRLFGSRIAVPVAELTRIRTAFGHVAA